MGFDCDEKDGDGKINQEEKRKVNKDDTRM
jgi:hypothetical protein